MRILYLDCSMGAAGDMLMAALYELLDDKQTFLDTMRGLGLPGIEISAEPAVKCGITGTHMKVLVHGSEELDSFHEHLHDANTIMRASPTTRTRMQASTSTTITQDFTRSSTCSRIWTCRKRCGTTRWRSIIGSLKRNRRCMEVRSTRFISTRSAR